MTYNPLEYYSKEELEKYITSRMIKASDGCWYHQGKPHEGTYVQFHLTRPTHKMFQAHRLAYLLWVGPLEEGLTIDHLCEHGNCVNPSHLEQISSRENSLRWVRKHPINTCPKGHLKQGKNLIINSAGHKICRECNKLQARKRYLRKKGKELGPRGRKQVPLEPEYWVADWGA